MKIIVLTFILTLFIFSCHREKDDFYKLDSNKLKCTWTLFKFRDKTKNLFSSLPENYSAGFTFYGTNCIYITGPCNSGQGKYEKSDNKIEIINLSLTERGCDALGYEKLFTDNLTGYYYISSDTLAIISDFDTDLFLVKADSSRTYNCVDY